MSLCLLAQRNLEACRGVYCLKDLYLQISYRVMCLRTLSFIITQTLNPWAKLENDQKSTK